MSNNIWEEVVRLVAEYDSTRPEFVKEYRLYYNTDGIITGMWESNHPVGDNYIVLDDPGLFYNANTLLLRVQNNKLIILDPRAPARSRLKKSNAGFRVVKDHAAIILESTETYSDIDYYERTNN